MRVNTWQVLLAAGLWASGIFATTIPLNARAPQKVTDANKCAIPDQFSDKTGKDSKYCEKLNKAASSVASTHTFKSTHQATDAHITVHTTAHHTTSHHSTKKADPTHKPKKSKKSKNKTKRAVETPGPEVGEDTNRLAVRADLPTLNANNLPDDMKMALELNMGGKLNGAKVGKVDFDKKTNVAWFYSGWDDFEQSIATYHKEHITPARSFFLMNALNERMLSSKQAYLDASRGYEWWGVHSVAYAKMLAQNHDGVVIVVLPKSRPVDKPRSDNWVHWWFNEVGTLTKSGTKIKELRRADGEDPKKEAEVIWKKGDPQLGPNAQPRVLPQISTGPDQWGPKGKARS